MRLRNVIAIVSVAFVTAVMLTPAPAAAITNGQLDGNGHPNVGALVVRFRGDLFPICSGTLISPSVFLTAGHCVSFFPAFGITEVFVTFDSTFSAGSTLIEAQTVNLHPGFGHDAADPHDLAVITFASPVGGLTPASLPTAGLLDQMAEKNGLKGRKFTAVGYGVLEPNIGGGPITFPDNLDRRFEVSTFRAITPAWLHLSQNAATGDGGTCFGDSGGPNFLGAGATTTVIVAAITVTGDAVCLATNVVYRLDTASARAFLSQFVTLP